MRTFLTIFALPLFLTSCREDTIVKRIECRGMTISDALPVQFWLTGCETYNERTPEGVHYVCWCQPWNSSDEIVTQFTDTPGQDFNMLVYNGETFLYNEPFLEISSGIYKNSFIPSEQGLTGRLQLLIAYPALAVDYLDLTGFTDDGLTTPWLIAPYQLNGKTMTSGNLSPSIPSGTNIDMEVAIASGTLQDFTAHLINSGGSIISSHVFGDISTGIHTINTTPGQIVTKIAFTAACNHTTQTGKVTSISITDASSTTLVNATDFSIGGWTSVDNGGTVNWNMNIDEAIAIGLTSGNPVTDYGRSPSFTSIPSGTSISGTFTHNVSLGCNGIFRLYAWNGATNEVVWESPSEILGLGNDITENIPAHVLIQSGTTNIQFVFSGSSGNVRVKDIFIEAAGTNYAIPCGDFQDTFSDWVQSGDGYTWTREFIGGTDGAAVLTIPSPRLGLDYTYTGGAGSIGRVLRSGLSIPSGNFDFFFEYNQEGGTTTRLLFEFRNNTTVINSVTTDITGFGNFTDTITLTGTVNNVRITSESLSGDGIMEITGLDLTEVSLESVIAKSDCIEIAASHDETILIKYSNVRNFAGLNYDDISPDITYSIRVPARFFHEIEPEEDEAIELTSSVITTSAQVKTQRLLEVKHAPYYFHKKLRRILKHQTLTIDGKQWMKEEKYEVSEGNKRWPEKSATCYLTEKNSIVRNVL